MLRRVEKSLEELSRAPSQYSSSCVDTTKTEFAVTKMLLLVENVTHATTAARRARLLPNPYRKSFETTVLTLLVWRRQMPGLQKPECRIQCR